MNFGYLNENFEIEYCYLLKPFFLTAIIHRKFGYLDERILKNFLGLIVLLLSPSYEIEKSTQGMPLFKRLYLSNWRLFQYRNFSAVIKVERTVLAGFLRKLF